MPHLVLYFYGLLALFRLEIQRDSDFSPQTIINNILDSDPTPNTKLKFETKGGLRSNLVNRRIAQLKVLEGALD